MSDSHLRVGHVSKFDGFSFTRFDGTKVTV
jgi:hypothetical protein